MKIERDTSPLEASDQRRDKLIRATLKVLITDGNSGLSVRRITKEANVAIGLIGHHFGSLDALVAEAYETLSNELVCALKASIEDAGTCPSARLDAFLKAYFTPVIMNPDLLNPWVAFWSLIRHSPQVNAVHSRTYGDTLALLENLLTDLAKGEGFSIQSPRLASISLAALLDGLWLESCLSAETLTLDDCFEITKRWVCSLRQGSYA